MTQLGIETINQRARERFPEARPRIILDNGPEFVAKDFKEFIRLCEMTHVKTSSYYLQSNGKIQRWHRSLKSECIKPGVSISLKDAERLVEKHVRHFNDIHLYGALGYVTPTDKLAGQEQRILTERDPKLESTRDWKRLAREAARKAS